MEMSETINELAAALAKAQADVEGAKKDSENPFFRSRYADLASVWDACRDALTKNGLAIVQSPRVVVKGDPEIVTRTSKNGEERDVVRVLTELIVTTVLLHSSGQWMRDEMSCVLPTSDPQAIGSGTTYLRRYSLAAFAGVAPEDDDGEAAMARGRASTAQVPNGAMTTVTVRVASPVLKKPSGWLHFKGDDGHVYETKSETFAQRAKDALEAAQPVVVTFKLGTYGSRNITDLVESAAIPEPVA